jgi:hypothetical protein
MSDYRGTLAKDKKNFYASFEVDGHSKLFADVVRQFIVSGADIDVSASTILQALFTPPTWVRSKFGRGTIGDPGLFEEACRDICRLIKEREANYRKWTEGYSRSMLDDVGNSTHMTIATSVCRKGVWNALKSWGECSGA